MRRKGKKKGFTLIELIVVIAILGILAAIAIPRMAGFTDKAKISADEQLAKLAQHSIQTLYAANDMKAAAETLTITKAASGAATYALATAANYTGSAANFQTAMTDLIGTDDNLVYYSKVEIFLTSAGDLDLTKGTNSTGITYTK